MLEKRPEGQTVEPELDEGPDLTCPCCGGDGLEDDTMPCLHCDGQGFEWWEA